MNPTTALPPPHPESMVVYKWTHTPTGKYYIGIKKRLIEYFDGYLSSSVEVASMVSTNPEEWERLIIKIYPPGGERFHFGHLGEVESELIREAVEEVGWEGVWNKTVGGGFGPFAPGVCAKGGRIGGPIGAAKAHAVKDADGKSVAGVKGGRIGGRIGAAKAHAVKDADGKSVAGVKGGRIGGRAGAAKVNAVKDADGKSVAAMKGGRAGAAKVNAVKDENGKSVAGVKGAAKVHAIKDADGKSVAAMKGLAKINAFLGPRNSLALECGCPRTGKPGQLSASWIDAWLATDPPRKQEYLDRFAAFEATLDFKIAA